MPIVKRYFLEIKKDNFKKNIEVEFPDKINIFFQEEKDDRVKVVEVESSEHEKNTAFYKG